MPSFLPVNMRRSEPSALLALHVCILAALGLMAPGPGCAAQPDTSPFLGPDQRLHDYAAFCRIVSDHYAYFPSSSTADWTRQCDRLRNDARDAADRDAYIAVLER